jgi:hypothetical protein
MTKSEAIEEFKADVLPVVVAKYGTGDKPALAEAWNNWTDALCKEGRITLWQYENWTHPQISAQDQLKASAVGASWRDKA